MVAHLHQSKQQYLVPYARMFPWRLRRLHILSHCKKHSLRQRQHMFNRVCKKHQKRLNLCPCSSNGIGCTKGVQEDVKEAETENMEAKITPTEVGKKFEEKIRSTKSETEHKKALPELPGIPLVHSNHHSKPGVIFIFDKASLVPAYVGKTYQILNPDDHANFMRRKKMNPYHYRPEIIHQVLVKILKSKLYRAGRVQGIYVKTEEGALMKIEPHTQIPETFGRFCSMMLELLQRFSIKAKGKREKLLQLVENPVTRHLPSNCYKIGFSFNADKVVPLKDYVCAIDDDMPLVFVVGAMAEGKINCDYTDDVISISEFPLSAVTCVRRICCAMEQKWKIAL